MGKSLTVAAVVVAAVVLAGCGGGSKGAATTPEGTARAMLTAIQAGDAQALAELYDYTASARAQNEDWGAIPKGQQDLILKEEAKRNATTLQPGLGKLQADYQGAQVGTAQVDGDAATVPVGTGTLQLVQRDGKWYLAGGVAQ
jgi:hypothetical protein